MLNSFESVNIQHVSRIENQEANDLALVTSGYMVYKQKLHQLIEIKDKFILIECPLTDLSMTKLVGAEGCWNKIRFTNITLRVGEIVETNNV